jgi:hypothetical protein
MSALAVVERQIAAGVGSVPDIARQSGIAESLIRDALYHLVRTGKVAAVTVGGCAPQACFACPLQKAGCSPLRTYRANSGQLRKCENPTSRE